MVIAHAKNVRLFSSLPPPLSKAIKLPVDLQSENSIKSSSTNSKELNADDKLSLCLNSNRVNCSMNTPSISLHLPTPDPHQSCASLPSSSNNQNNLSAHLNKRPQQSRSLNSLPACLVIAQQLRRNQIESNHKKNSKINTYGDTNQIADNNNHNNNVNTTINLGNIYLTVRDLLLLERGLKGWYNGQVLPCVAGIVVYKGLLADEKHQISENRNKKIKMESDHVNNSSNKSSYSNSYKDFCKKQEADYYQKNVLYFKTKEESNIRKCTLIIRDENRSEIVTIYLPVTVASAIMVGFRIVVYNSTIYLAENLRTLYLKYSLENNTQIGRYLAFFYCSSFLHFFFNIFVVNTIFLL